MGMISVYENQKQKVQVQTLEVGDFFVDTYFDDPDFDIYIVIKSSWDTTNKDIVAISLYRGESVYFNSLTEVYPVQLDVGFSYRSN